MSDNVALEPIQANEIVMTAKHSAMLPDDRPRPLCRNPRLR